MSAASTGRSRGLRTSVTMANGTSSTKFRAIAKTAIARLIHVADKILGFESAVHNPLTDQPVNAVSVVSNTVGTFWKANLAMATMGMMKYSAIRTRNAHFATDDASEALMTESTAELVAATRS